MGLGGREAEYLVRRSQRRGVVGMCFVLREGVGKGGAQQGQWSYVGTATYAAVRHAQTLGAEGGAGLGVVSGRSKAG